MHVSLYGNGIGSIDSRAMMIITIMMVIDFDLRIQDQHMVLIVKIYPTYAIVLNVPYMETIFQNFDFNLKWFVSLQCQSRTFFSTPCSSWKTSISYGFALIKTEFQVKDLLPSRRLDKVNWESDRDQQTFRNGLVEVYREQLITGRHFRADDL